MYVALCFLLSQIQSSEARCSSFAAFPFTSKRITYSNRHGRSLRHVCLLSYISAGYSTNTALYQFWSSESRLSSVNSGRPIWFTVLNTSMPTLWKAGRAICTLRQS